MHRPPWLLAPLLIACSLLLACGGAEGVRIVPAAGTAAPTPTPGTGIPVEQTSTPEPEDEDERVPVPPRPSNLFAGAIPVSEYLAGSLAKPEECLPDLVEEWELAPVEGDRCRHIDLDGDGETEFLFLILEPGNPSPAGEVWFFDDDAAGRALLSSARALANEPLTGVRFVGEEDLTGDGRLDSVIAAEQCGASTCVTDLVIASTHRGFLEDLAPDGIAMDGLESAQVADANEDGLPDVVMTGGVAGSVGAGPQRPLTRRISWNGVRFTRADEPEPPTYLFHLVVDADKAFESGDYAAALDLYQQAARDQALLDWKVEVGQSPGRPELQAYSLFRAALSAERLGDTQRAHDLLLNASQQYTATMHGIAAAIYYAAVTGGQPPGAACDGAEAYLRTTGGRYEQAWDYGHTNPPHPLTSLCR